MQNIDEDLSKLAKSINDLKIPNYVHDVKVDDTQDTAPEGFLKLISEAHKNNKIIKNTNIYLRESTRRSGKKIYEYNTEREKFNTP